MADGRCHRCGARRDKKPWMLYCGRCWRRVPGPLRDKISHELIVNNALSQETKRAIREVMA